MSDWKQDLRDRFSTYREQEPDGLWSSIEAGLTPRVHAGLCADGELTLRVGDECFGIRVAGREVSVFDADTAQYTFEPEELQALILQLNPAAADSRIPLGWFPLSV